MSCYTIPNLGPLQQRILKHFFECQERQVESINHISRVIAAQQPSVSRSVANLIKEKFLSLDRDEAAILKREAGRKFFEKPLYVTDKGMMYAVVILGMKYDQILDYSEKYGHPSTSQIRHMLDEYFPNKEKRESIVRKGFEFFLNNNLFDEAGNQRLQLTQEEGSRLRLHMQNVAFQHLESVLVNNPGQSSIRDIVDRAEISRGLMMRSLKRRKMQIDQAIREMEEHPNS